MANADVSRLNKELEALSTISSSAESRATNLQKQVDVLNTELQGFRIAHDAELELLGEEQSGHAKKQRKEFEEYKLQAETELEDMRRKLADALRLADQHQATADAAADQLQAAAVEATAYRRAEIQARETAIEARQAATAAQNALARALADSKHISEIDDSE